MQRKKANLNLVAVLSAMWGKRAPRILQLGCASVLLCAFMIATPALAGPKKAKDLDGKSASEQVDVIIQFVQSPTQKHFDKVKKHGGSFKKNFRSVKGGLFSVRAAELDALANDPDVAYISPNRSLSGAADYFVQTVGADIAQRSYDLDGSGVGIAVIDSGVSPHDDLENSYNGSSRVVYNQNFTGSGDSSDGYGHGTHVAGIIAGNGSDSDAYHGVAPKSKIINLRVLKSDGSGTDAGVIAAIERAIELKNTYNIRVINLSLGRRVKESYTVDPLCQAVEAAWQAGIVVVVSAGNFGRDNSLGTSGYGMIASPANDPYVITVGATNTLSTLSRSDDYVATYSSKGPTLIDHVVKPDLVAPGNAIVSLNANNSTLSNTYLLNRVFVWTYSGLKPRYFRLSGTSMAAPVVSGAAALLLEQTPSLNPDQVKARLMKTAWKNFPRYSSVTANGVTTTIQNDVFTVGAGYLDIAAALENSDQANGTAMSPVAVRDELGNVTLVADASAVWDNSVMWGASVLWGSSVVWGSDAMVNGTSVLWGNSVLWGSTTVDGYSVIWGSSVIWGASDDAAAQNIDVEGDPIE